MSRSGRRHRARSAGFTLVEVLVALVVTSLILAIVMNASIEAKTRAVAASEKEEAVILARSLIAEGSVGAFRPGRREGAAGPLRWQLSEDVLADPGSQFVLAGIKASVRNARGATLATLETRKIKTVPRR